MSVQGKWRIIEMPDYEADFTNMMGPAYILFDKSGGEFAFGCVTGAIHGTADTDAVEFTGLVTTKWMKPVATDGPNYKTMELSKDRFASREEMKPISSLAVGTLFQQPARPRNTKKSTAKIRANTAP